MPKSIELAPAGEEIFDLYIDKNKVASKVTLKKAIEILRKEVDTNGSKAKEDMGQLPGDR